MTEYWHQETKIRHLELARRLEECLTRSEREITRCAMTTKGLTARQIAGCIGSRPNTVESHIKSIRTKANEIYNESVTFGFIISELKCYFFISDLC
jgi:DNA-binding CsgD family transcriptional regulator